MRPQRTDHGTPAQRARVTLADPRSTATLHVDGVAAPGETLAEVAVGMHEHGGAPTFFCVADGDLAAAALRGAPAVVVVDRAEDGRVGATRVVVGGRLAHLGVREGEDGAAAVVSVVPAMVTVEDDDGVGVPVTAEELAAAPRSWSPDLRRTVEHLNSGHAAQVRRLAARVGGLRGGVEAVAAADLVAVDRDGLLVRWVDAAGGWTVRHDFERPAESLAEVVRRLQALLG